MLQENLRTVSLAGISKIDDWYIEVACNQYFIKAAEVVTQILKILVDVIVRWRILRTKVNDIIIYS